MLMKYAQDIADLLGSIIVLSPYRLYFTRNWQRIQQNHKMHVNTPKVIRNETVMHLYLNVSLSALGRHGYLRAH